MFHVVLRQWDYLEHYIVHVDKKEDVLANLPGMAKNTVLETWVMEIPTSQVSSKLFDSELDRESYEEGGADTLKDFECIQEEKQ